MKASINRIEPAEDMFRAYISLPNHFDAIEVIGTDFDECVTRAVIIRDAFNEKKERKS